MRTVLPALLLLLALPQEKKYRLPSTDLKQQVIWGSTVGDLSFGGQDQKAEDGNPHTRFRGETLTFPPNPKRAKAREVKDAAAKARHLFFEGRGNADEVRRLSAEQVALEREAEKDDAEPPPRALSPLALDAKTGLYVLFGGDHFDYLTNDTWTFDPASRRWTRRSPKSCPPPRANHKLAAAGDGKIVLTGGYTYTSTTDYVGGPYRDLNDGEWTYDIASDAWSGGGAESRTYRTGRLHPDFYLEGPAPAPTKVDPPVNTWVAMKPPHLPAMNRDWGTAVLDPDRDLILRWSGGHSAHGGTDVLHYHLSTNRWELPIPVELPLGQTYSNTEYPEGVNFNRRPWVTGHTYQSYGYDPHLKKMLFTGRREDCHVYDPDLGDWSGRFPKPKGMTHGDCFYTLTLTPTPQGLVCWTKDGSLFRFEGKDWVEKPLQGKLPGSVVDNSTVAYDSKRERLLFWRKPYGDKAAYDGRIQVVDLKTWTVGVLEPAGNSAGVPYLCQIRYDGENDLFLVGGTLPPGDDGFRRTPAYDPEGNRWVSLKIPGDDPSGPRGRNVSLGLMYDARRKVFWAVDTNSKVFVLRLDPKTADLQPVK